MLIIFNILIAIKESLLYCNKTDKDITNDTDEILNYIDYLDECRKIFDKKFNRVSRDGICAYLETKTTQDTIDIEKYTIIFIRYENNILKTVAIKNEKIKTLKTSIKRPLIIKVPKGMAGKVIGKHRKNIKYIFKKTGVFLRIIE